MTSIKLYKHYNILILTQYCNTEFVIKKHFTLYQIYLHTLNRSSKSKKLVKWFHFRSHLIWVKHDSGKLKKYGSLKCFTTKHSVFKSTFELSIHVPPCMGIFVLFVKKDLKHPTIGDITGKDYNRNICHQSLRFNFKARNKIK